MGDKTAHRTSQFDLFLINLNNFPVTLSRTIGYAHLPADLKRKSSEKKYLLFHTVTPG